MHYTFHLVSINDYSNNHFTNFVLWNIDGSILECNISSIYRRRSCLIFRLFSAPISAPLGCSFRPHSITLTQQNWSLDPIIRDACAGEMFENIFFLISVIVTFANFSLI